MGHVDSAPDVFRNLRVRLEEVRDRAIHKLETDLQRWCCVDLREWLGAQQHVHIVIFSSVRLLLGYPLHFSCQRPWIGLTGCSSGSYVRARFEETYHEQTW